jgi:hypothetical protein
MKSPKVAPRSGKPANVIGFPHGRGFVPRKPLFKDPVLLVVTTAITSSNIPLYQIAKRSKVSSTTIRNWMENKTRRPQFFTVSSVMAVLGRKVEWK